MYLLQNHKHQKIGEMKKWQKITQKRLKITFHFGTKGIGNMEKSI